MRDDGPPGGPRPRRSPLSPSHRHGRPLPELDEATLRRCVAGEAGARRDFVRMYEKRVMGYLSRRVLPRPRRAELDDLAQEVFKKALEGLRSFAPPSERHGGAKVSTWLFKIARNAASDWRAVDSRHETIKNSQDEKVRPSAAGSPEQEVQRMELGRALQEAMSRLPEEQRDALFLFDVEGQSLEEIAEIRGTPVNTVKTRIRRARERMREHMKGYKDEHKE